MDAQHLADQHIHHEGSTAAQQEKKLRRYYRNTAGGFAPGTAVVSNRIRALVSLKKKRFQQDG